MIEPLIPYITLPEIPILPAFDMPGVGAIDALTIKPFGALVATGVYAGWALSLRQAKRLGLDVEVMNSFIAWVVGIGFVGGHVFDVILYHPDKLTKAASPMAAFQELIFLWRSLSSFGGFAGAVIGLFLWKYRFRVRETMPWADIVISAFPLSWVFGRSGCSVAHDHPGLRSEVWFAVQYPGGGRFDLGLYEMLFTIPLALTFLYLMRKPRPPGFFAGLVCMVYAPTRFALDFLRAQDVRDADPRHLGLTPAQWLCFLMLAVGVYLYLKAMKGAEEGDDMLLRARGVDARLVRRPEASSA
ncbi:MAG: prolipoprotein diacylglyceryl transferase [Myxococcales bacterium]|nr:prolipoprotein diacylglyceryl transferase [Polyangiaceae bacterium]MDW8252000.1 prolipoprotein diacylglyceryl transferase [Myxococcales bacterium]